MRSRHHVEEGEETGIDLAPMLDFVLNLLIFFIITAVFAKEIGLTVNRAGAAPAGSTKEGLPVGVQIVGRPFEERRVLRAARVVEAALGGRGSAP